MSFFKGFLTAYEQGDTFSTESLSSPYLLYIIGNAVLGQLTGMFGQTVLGGWYKSRANGALMDIGNLFNAELSMSVRKTLTDIDHFVCAVLRQMVNGLGLRGRHGRCRCRWCSESTYRGKTLGIAT